MNINDLLVSGTFVHSKRKKIRTIYTKVNGVLINLRDILHETIIIKAKDLNQKYTKHLLHLYGLLEKRKVWNKHIKKN